MHLKSIEVQGFKSFANKLVFKFDKGITGIVGPNGSGKSNVADAVRWVLGEQSAKQLRSSKMEDVIFSGTELRKPLGFAYVAITMDNSDKKLPVDYDEVTVARRVYRSGESEYLLNGGHCRLKDIQEMFFDTGIGKEGYSIIGQGQIDKILSGKPDERRELFDEAAGIVKYKKRKQAAQKNLDIERDNLSRVSDILSVLEKQVGPLKKQEEKAREYLKLRDELKGYDVNLYLREYTRIRDELKELEEKTVIVQDDFETTKQQYEQVKEDYSKVEAQIEALDLQIDEHNKGFNESKLEMERLAGEIKVYTEQITAIRKMLESDQLRINDISKQIKDKNEELQKLFDEKQKIDSELGQLNDERSNADQTQDQMNANIVKLRTAIDEKNGAIIDYLNEASSVKANISRYDSMIEQLGIRKSEVDQRLIVLKSESADATNSVDSYEADLKKKMAEIHAAQEENQRLTAQNERCSAELTDLRRTLDQKQQEFHQTNSRYTALKNISERYDGYGNSIKKVMEQKSRTPGILGVVADIVSVPKKYETAIEIALGGSIQNIVTDNERTAKEMIAYLKTNRLGRATFLPLTSVKGKKAQTEAGLMQEPGAICLACDAVTYAPSYEGLINYLLGRILIVDHIDHALAIVKKYKYSLRIVTLEGELLSPGGSLSGGAYKNSGNLLGRNREMQTLAQSIEKIKHDIDEIHNKIRKTQDERNEVRRALDQYQISLQELSLEENTIRMNLNQAKKGASERASSYQEYTAENQSLKQQIQDATTAKKTLNVTLEELSQLQKDARDYIEVMSQKLEEALEEARTYSEETADLRLKESGYTQRSQFINENVRRIRSELSRLDDESMGHEDAIAAHEEEIKLKEAAIKDAEEAQHSIQAAIETEDTTLAALNGERDKLSESQKNFFARREEISERINQLDKEIFRLNHQTEKLDEQRTASSNYMWEEYELTYNSAIPLKNETLEEYTTQVLKKRMNELKTEIKNLGNVNVNAIEEYKEVSQQYIDMKTQHDDICEAEAKLVEIISALDKSMRAQFTEKFKEIQVNFDRVFKELFGGGHGALELLEDEDVLYAGIRIIASPPGKKLQNMMQLSGGEKALTAIALLFAIQSLKPSPFCLLDEIEAALDDANVKRYAQYLNRLTSDTQFIIITHRRGTMNAADVLYGITMQEKGVSTLVSVNLIDSKLDD